MYNFYTGKTVKTAGIDTKLFAFNDIYFIVKITAVEHF